MAKTDDAGEQRRKKHLKDRIEDAKEKKRKLNAQLSGSNPAEKARIKAAIRQLDSEIRICTRDLGRKGYK